MGTTDMDGDCGDSLKSHPQRAQTAAASPTLCSLGQGSLCQQVAGPRTRLRAEAGGHMGFCLAPEPRTLASPPEALRAGQVDICGEGV